MPLQLIEARANPRRKIRTPIYTTPIPQPTQKPVVTPIPTLRPKPTITPTLTPSSTPKALRILGESISRETFDSTPFKFNLFPLILFWLFGIR
jgi:hypothetical protein